MSSQKQRTYIKGKADDPILEYVSPLIYQMGDVGHCFGTAVIIGPYMALTAKHVVEEYAKQAGVSLMLGVNTNVDFHLLIAQRTPSWTASWFVDKIYLSSATDIALLFLRPGDATAAKYDFARRLRLALHPPRPGAWVAGFGYPQSTVNKNAPNDYTLGLDSHTTIGTVGTVYRNKRDSANLNFPCFEVNARIDGGMSGGPVFSNEGHLLGLMCAGWEFDKSGSHLGYVACLWPLMPMIIDIPREGRPADERYRVLDLARGGLLGAKDWDRVKVQTNEDGTEDYIFLADKGFSQYTE